MNIRVFTLALLAVATCAFADDKPPTNLDWVKSSLYLPDPLSKEVASYMDSFPDAIRNDGNAMQAVQGILTSRIQLANGDKTQVEAVLAYLRKALPPAKATLESVGAEGQKAQNYSTAVDWIRKNLLVSDDRAKKLANFVIQYPQDQIQNVELTLQTRVGMSGTEKLEEIAAAFGKKVPSAGNADQVSTNVQNEYSNAQTDLKMYNWAHDNGLPSDLGLEIIRAMDLQPDKADDITAQVAQLVQQGKGRTDIEASLSNVAKFYSWALSPDGKKVVGCTQKSVIDSKYQAKVALQACTSTLKDVKYRWANDAQTSCGLYTSSGALIQSTVVENCADPIVRDLRPCLKTLDHDYRFYHYTTLDKIDATKDAGMSEQDAIQNHAQLWANHVWESHQQGNAGLYTAIDPLASRDFGGGRDMHLYRVQIPQGTTYIELQRGGNDDSCPFSPESMKELQDAGCPTDLDHLVENEYLPLPQPSCYPLMRRIFNAVHLRGWAYPYAMTNFQGCSNRPAQAFVWIDLDHLPKDNIQVFGSNPPPVGDPAHKEAVEIERLYNDAGGRLWPSLDGEASSSGGRTADQIKGDTLLGCEALRPKPAVTDPVSCGRQPANGLEETQATITKLKTAINKKQKKQ